MKETEQIIKLLNQILYSKRPELTGASDSCTQKYMRETIDWLLCLSVNGETITPAEQEFEIDCHTICVSASQITHAISDSAIKDSVLGIYIGERPVFTIPLDCLIEIYNGKYNLHSFITIVNRQSVNATITEKRSGKNIESLNGISIYLCCTLARVLA